MDFISQDSNCSLCTHFLLETISGSRDVSSFIDAVSKVYMYLNRLKHLYLYSKCKGMICIVPMGHSTRISTVPLCMYGCRGHGGTSNFDPWTV